MKKIIITLITLICILLAFNLTSFANTITDYETIKREFNNDLDIIIETVNDFAYDELKNSVTENDIDFSKIITVYYNTNILQNKEINTDDINTLKETAERFFYLPIYYDNYTVLYTITKGVEATEEQKNSGVFSDEDIEYIDKVANRLHASSYSVQENKWDYAEHIDNLIKKNNINNADVTIIGGAAENIDTLAIICHDNKEIKFLILNGSDTDNHMINSENPSDKLYSYEEIKKIAIFPDSSNQGKYGSAAADNNTKEKANDYKLYTLATAGAVLAVAAAAAAVTFAIIKKHKKVSENAE